jgi:hypothetical protein
MTRLQRTALSKDFILNTLKGRGSTLPTSIAFLALIEKHAVMAMMTVRGQR